MEEHGLTDAGRLVWYSNIVKTDKHQKFWRTSSPKLEVNVSNFYHSGFAW